MTIHFYYDNSLGYLYTYTHTPTHHLHILPIFIMISYFADIQYHLTMAWVQRVSLWVCCMIDVIYMYM